MSLIKTKTFSFLLKQQFSFVSRYGICIYVGYRENFVSGVEEKSVEMLWNFAENFFISVLSGVFSDSKIKVFNLLKFWVLSFLKFCWKFWNVFLEAWDFSRFCILK